MFVNGFGRAPRVDIYSFCYTSHITLLNTWVVAAAGITLAAIIGISCMFSLL